MKFEINRKKNNRLILLNLVILLIFIIFFICTKSIVILGFTILLALMLINNICLGKNESIIFNNQELIYINKFGKEEKYLLEKVKYRREKVLYKHNRNSIPEVTCKTTFYFNNKKIFSLLGIECTEEENNNIINISRKLKKKYDTFNGEEIFFEVKPCVLPLILNLYVCIFSLFFIVMFSLNLKSILNSELFTCYIIFILVLLYFGIELLRMISLKIYFIENKGFYRVRFGKANYYEFADIDRCIVKGYLFKQRTAYKAKIYKDGLKVLTVTNSFRGFYNFLDEMQNKY